MAGWNFLSILLCPPTKSSLNMKIPMNLKFQWIQHHNSPAGNPPECALDLLKEFQQSWAQLVLMQPKPWWDLSASSLRDTGKVAPVCEHPGCQGKERLNYLVIFQLQRDKTRGWRDAMDVRSTDCLQRTLVQFLAHIGSLPPITAVQGICCPLLPSKDTRHAHADTQAKAHTQNKI